jgi:hypothetical protein
MIGYASRFGVNIPTEALQTIMAAKEAYKNGSLGAADEAKFYTSFNDISKAIAPVTPASLDACLNERATTYKAWPWSKAIPLSYAKVAVRHYHRTAFIALMALLAMQVYWVVGATLVSSIPQLNPQQSQSSRENDRGSAKPSPVPQADATMAQPSQSALAEDSKAIEVSRQATAVWLLAIWSAPWQWLQPLFARTIPSEVATLRNQANPQWNLGISAQFVLTVLQTYVLPLLYGWVGAMAYVLRSLISSIKDRTFRREHEVEYNLRTYLGLLSGLAIGWFVGSNVSTTGVTSLAPAAISFLAGYSVEILFSTMDRLVAAFGSAPAPPPPSIPAPTPALTTSPGSRAAGATHP